MNMENFSQSGSEKSADTAPYNTERASNK